MTGHEHAEPPAWQYAEVDTVEDVRRLAVENRVPRDASLQLYGGDEYTEVAVTWYGYADGCEHDHLTNEARDRRKRDEANGA